MQMAFYFDQTLCTGCATCIVACKDWHDVPTGPASWTRVIAIEKGAYPNPFIAFLKTSCYHCANPECINACPVNAITKRQEDGVVIVDTEICLGKASCSLCKEACPYDAPQFSAEENAKMKMCNFCYDDRLSNSEPPICVAACPMMALDYGPLEELKSKYGDVQNAEGFSYSSKMGPSIIFKPKFSEIPDTPRISVAPMVLDHLHEQRGRQLK